MVILWHLIQPLAVFVSFINLHFSPLSFVKVCNTSLKTFLPLLHRHYVLPNPTSSSNNFFLSFTTKSSSLTSNATVAVMDPAVNPPCFTSFIPTRLFLNPDQISDKTLCTLRQLCCVTRAGKEDTEPQDLKTKQLEGRGAAQDTPKNPVIVFLLYLVVMIAAVVSDLKNLRALKPVYLLKRNVLHSTM